MCPRLAARQRFTEILRQGQDKERVYAEKEESSYR